MREDVSPFLVPMLSCYLKIDSLISFLLSLALTLNFWSFWGVTFGMCCYWTEMAIM